jgi:hypothetical protein
MLLNKEQTIDSLRGLWVVFNPSLAADHVRISQAGAFDRETFVNQSVIHSRLMSAFKRAEADAAHKSALIKAASIKGPKAIAVAVEVAAKAAKRRDSFAKKLTELGVDLGG